MSQSSQPEVFSPIPMRALLGLAKATVLGTWGVWTLPGDREERQAEAEDRIRRGCETMGASQLETEAAVFEYRDWLS